jgi:hypothetical protein
MSDDKEEESKTESRKLGTFYAGLTKYFQMFLPDEPDDIFAALCWLLNQKQIYPIKDDKKWKLTYEVEIESEECEVQLKLLKLDDKGNLCVDFMRLGGS